MPPKASRVPRKLFPGILSSRNFKNSAFFTLRAGVSKEKSPRVAVSISKKISKSAVVRNTLRRRVYAVLSRHMTSLQPSLYLFIAKAGADKLKSETLEKEIIELLNSH